MEDKNFLIVSESFYSIQGEGKTTGVPAVFLRLSGCNILCKSESWICDTIEVWKKGIKTPFEQVLQGDNFDKLRQGAHLVITGGEPLLHQKKIVEFIQWFEKGYGWRPIIEVETNGTIKPNDYLQMVVNHWNVSPKLYNSGEVFGKRFKPDALHCFNSLRTSIFKFVISKEEDFKDLSKTYLPLIQSSKVYLMPAGENQEQLLESRLTVVELCKEFCFKYTERLHIVIWNKKTGV
jgi:7-carboxy-7-deazaguanine synthase